MDPAPSVRLEQSINSVFYSLIQYKINSFLAVEMSLLLLLTEIVFHETVCIKQWAFAIKLTANRRTMLEGLCSPLFSAQQVKEFFKLAEHFQAQLLIISL